MISEVFFHVGKLMFNVGQVAHPSSFSQCGGVTRKCKKKKSPFYKYYSAVINTNDNTFITLWFNPKKIAYFTLISQIIAKTKAGISC